MRNSNFRILWKIESKQSKILWKIEPFQFDSFPCLVSRAHLQPNFLLVDIKLYTAEKKLGIDGTLLCPHKFCTLSIFPRVFCVLSCLHSYKIAHTSTASRNDTTTIMHVLGRPFCVSPQMQTKNRLENSVSQAFSCRAAPVGNKEDVILMAIGKCRI